MAELYSLHQVSKRFGDREVLCIEALTLEPGLIYGLLGPNGAGKTTLMRLLSFIDMPSSGTVRFMGETVLPEQAAQKRAKVVWVPQTPVMFSGTLLYNVEYPMKIKGVPATERRERAMALLETVKLDGLARAPARRLSGGEAQRGSIARALAAGAQVILFDEPTGNVDFQSREDIIELIFSLWQSRGLSVFVTTHDAELADVLCQKRVHMFNGRVVLPENMPRLKRALLSQQGQGR
jgi:ABC-type multidrug transport system, ATPase component